MSTPERKTPKASLGFPRTARITRGAELQRITREGKRIRTAYFEVRVAAFPYARMDTTWSGMRVGLVVPLYRRSAVLRNRLKRQLRELIRLRFLPLHGKRDLVVKIFPDAYEASFEALNSAIVHVYGQLAKMIDGAEAAGLPI